MIRTSAETERNQPNRRLILSGVFAVALMIALAGLLIFGQPVSAGQRQEDAWNRPPATGLPNVPTTPRTPAGVVQSAGVPTGVVPGPRIAP